MNYILNIDTAVTSASVCLSLDGKSLDVKTNPETKDSAAWLHPAIQQLMAEQQVTLQQLSAVAISAGPGSYTGLRVGMAAAKGLCYALGKPLITVNTLQMIAAAAVTTIDTALICPMIDARRMEVFAAVFDKTLTEVIPTEAIILDTDSFHSLLDQQPVTFTGNGSQKFEAIQQHPNAKFVNVTVNASHIAVLAHMLLIANNFADLAYGEPFYGKEFYSPASNK